MNKKIVALCIVVASIAGTVVSVQLYKQNEANLAAQRAEQERAVEEQRYSAFLAQLSAFADHFSTHVEATRKDGVRHVFNGDVTLGRPVAPCFLGVHTTWRSVEGPEGTPEELSHLDHNMESDYDGVPLADPTLTFSLSHLPPDALSLGLPDDWAGFWKLTINRPAGFHGAWRGWLTGSQQKEDWMGEDATSVSLYYDDAHVQQVKDALNALEHLKHSCSSPPVEPTSM